jgi:outer membrane cobalamin receptor
MRVEHSELTGSTSASPWLLGEWRVGARTRIRAGAALHHQIPRVEQGQLVEPGVTLEAERSRSWDVGIERTLADDWRLGVEVYRRRESDVLRLIGAEPFVENGAIVRPGDPHWENALSGNARGAGVRLERRSANGLSGWLTYSFDRTDLTDAARQESFPADFDQRHTVNAYGTYRWSGRTALSAKWRYGSNFPLAGYYERQAFGYSLSSERNRERLPIYSRFDVRAERTFTRQRSRMTLYVEVLNLLNRDNLGPGDANYNVVTGRVSDLVEEVFPLLPSAGLLIEF